MDTRASQFLVAIFCAAALAGCQLPSGINVVRVPEPNGVLPPGTPAPSIASVEGQNDEGSDDDSETAVVLPLQPIAKSVRQDTGPEQNQSKSTAEESLAQITRILEQWQEESTDKTEPSSGRKDKLLRLLGDAINSSSEQTGSGKVRTVSAEVAVEPRSPLPKENVEQGPEAFPVDLPTVLRLAGGRNWAVQLAWERICEARADVQAAEAMWVPSLNLGIGATKHEGQIQSTTGEVIDVSRNSLFLGGGAKTANAPMAGGGGGPARFFVDLSIADALFQPLVTRQLSNAARSRHAIEFNNAQRDAALAYFDLVAAQGSVSIGRQNLADGEGLLAMTEAFVAAGKASSAEVSRVRVIVARQKQALVAADLRLRLASAELVRLVRLDPKQLSAEALLYSADDALLPLELISESTSVQALISQGQRTRPEVSEQYAQAQARLADARSQELRPYIPNLNVAMSAGGFGGGRGSDINNFDGRADFDALLVWEVRNFGLGESAARNQTNSRYRQAVLDAHRMQDQIAAEVRSAWHSVNAGRKRMELAQENVEEASRGLSMNLERIRGLEGLPLEAVQALNAVADARLTYLNAIVTYNKAQAELLRAIGRPVQNAL